MPPKCYASVERLNPANAAENDCATCEDQESCERLARLARVVAASTPTEKIVVPGTPGDRAGLILENAIEIARTAQCILDEADKTPEDSKGFNQLIQQWAEEFEVKFGQKCLAEEVDYYEKIDEFTKEKMKEGGYVR